MSEIPTNTVTLEDMVKWGMLVEQLAKVKLEEAAMRRKIFKYHFPKPEEGTNTYPLANNYVLKGTYSIERNVDEGVLLALSPLFIENKINVEKLIRRKPELAVKEYRTLTAEQVAIFDRALIIKPTGTPGLEIVLPAKFKEK